MCFKTERFNHILNIQDWYEQKTNTWYMKHSEEISVNKSDIKKLSRYLLGRNSLTWFLRKRIYGIIFMWAFICVFLFLFTLSNSLGTYLSIYLSLSLSIYIYIYLKTKRKQFTFLVSLWIYFRFFLLQMNNLEFLLKRFHIASGENGIWKKIIFF